MRSPSTPKHILEREGNSFASNINCFLKILKSLKVAKYTVTNSRLVGGGCSGSS